MNKRRDAATVAAVARELSRRGMTVAVAESCTGGMLAARLTSAPGSSKYFVGGVVAYANSVKVGLLGVARESLDTHGAVSHAVASQMAAGARARLRADVGVGITGIAGPTGGTPDKPVGLVYVAVASDEAILSRRHRFEGSRTAVRGRAARAALAMIVESLEALNRKESNNEEEDR